MDQLYPPGPVDVPPSLTAPTRQYRQKAWIAVACLALFIGLYIALAGWFAWTAWRLFDDAMAGGSNVLMHWLVGAGAAFFAVFMLKALFFVRRGGAPDAVEITAADQPRLFAFLYRLADDAGAPRPRRVYLSARVNAAVFYDLSLFNLLLPSHKNLEIGLALVNVLTISELKAVLAHEFGHFAQRSMAIGSWVYIAQQIATQIVARRDVLDRFLRGLSRFDLRVAWVGWLLSLVVWSIRSLMDTLLRLVVLAQRALSRQMEFQADLVAVSLTGSDELVHALHKLNAADDAWERTLAFAAAEHGCERRPQDLFEVQTRLIARVGEILGDAHYGRVPTPADGPSAGHRVFRSSLAHPPQMWATHPVNRDREENAKRVYLPAAHDPRSAWLLFDAPQMLGERVVAGLFDGDATVAVDRAQTLAALERRYDRPQYDPRYRGAYLGRELTRHARRPSELLAPLPSGTDTAAALAALYPASLADDLAHWRELAEEKALLEAVKAGTFEPAGGRLLHRGREVPRRELPALIARIEAEERTARQRLIDHDASCRSAHFAAATRLGNGWAGYLAGRIATLHYAEHRLADLQDANGAFGNVYAIVTADGKVSARELKRLVAAANELHAVLAQLDAEADRVQLDARLLECLEVADWRSAIGPFALPRATKDNIGDWLGAIGGWVDAWSGALSALATQALETLLHDEARAAAAFATGTMLDAAPSAARMPDGYPVRLTGQLRKRQSKLDLWDRFQTADGLVPAAARLLVAGSIVAAVLGFGGVAASTHSVMIYNGLGRPVVVASGDARVQVPAFSARAFDVVLNAEQPIEALSDDGTLIERFAPTLSGRGQQYVYNVAAAAPLVEWTQTYGNASERPPRMLGAPRWTTTRVDILFAEPPESIRIKGSGGSRSVLTGLGDRAPAEQFELVEDAAARQHMVDMHLRWDADNSPHHAQWQAAAQR